MNGFITHGWYEGNAWRTPLSVCIHVGLARTIYIRFTYGIFGLEITKYTVYIYVYIRFWPTLQIAITRLYILNSLAPWLWWPLGYNLMAMISWLWWPLSSPINKVYYECHYGLWTGNLASYRPRDAFVSASLYVSICEQGMNGLINCFLWSLIVRGFS